MSLAFIDVTGLLEQAKQGDSSALNTLFDSNRDRLRRMVQLRLHEKVRARVDASDVIQEAQLEAFQRLPEYFDHKEGIPFFLWLRLIVGQQLIHVHRQHLGTQKRDPRREVGFGGMNFPSASSVAIAEELVATQSSPSEAFARKERVALIQTILDAMDPADREILALRHFERLSRTEAAIVLGISEAAAAKRFTRALERFQCAMSSLPEFRNV